MRKSFNEIVRLEPAVDKYQNDNHEQDVKNIKWTYNNLANSYTKLNVRKQKLVIAREQKNTQR